MTNLVWSYGVTTVPERKETHLPRTLASLNKAGWGRPGLFIDGGRARDYDTKYEATARSRPVRVAGHWHLTLLELYHREPSADLYAVFQDDVIFCRNVRRYVESCRCPPGGYMNLFTFRENEQVVLGRGPGWHEAAYIDGAKTRQGGKGALALIFPRDACVALLCHPHLLERATDARRGHKAIDGGVVTSLNLAGYKEYVHNPSLVQHTGDHSTIGNNCQAKALTWPGEDFDAETLLSWEAKNPSRSRSLIK